MNEEINTLKTKVLEAIKASTYEMPVGLLGYTLHVDVAEVKQAITALRQDGHLIIRNERGYFLATSREQYERWRDTYYTPKMLEMVNVLKALQGAARQQFGKTSTVVLTALQDVEVGEDANHKD